MSTQIIRVGDLSVPFRSRSLIVTVTLLALSVIAGFITLGTGALPVPPMGVIRTALGVGDPGDQFAVWEIGLPRLAVGLLAGMALGAGGSLVQAYTRNPLGSPDVIGFDAGAATGGLVGLLILHLPPNGYALAAVGGGLLTAAAVIYLARGGFDSGYRLILIGIGVGAMLLSVNGYLLTRATTYESMAAARWLSGSLNSSDWADAGRLAVGLILLLPAAVVLARHLRALQLGGDSATALGVRVGAVTTVTLVVAVCAAALAVGCAGPISFVALAAPQLAHRLTGGHPPEIMTSAAMGGFLVVASDFVAQRAFGDIELPVGVVTGAVGGGYLCWLLASEWRRGRIR